DVVAHARTRYALDAADHGLAVLCVLERDGDRLARMVCRRRHNVVGLDVALLLQDPRELALQPGGRDRNIVVLGLCAVAQARQEVGDGIGHGHAITSSTWSSRGCTRCAPTRAGRSGTGRTCGTR